MPRKGKAEQRMRIAISQQIDFEESWTGWRHSRARAGPSLLNSLCDLSFVHFIIYKPIIFFFLICIKNPWKNNKS